MTQAATEGFFKEQPPVNTEDFVTQHPKHQTKRCSAIFHILKNQGKKEVGTLAIEGISTMLVDKKTAGRYFLISLNHTQRPEDLFTNYDLTEQHLRIDEYYIETPGGNTKDGLAHFHYTAVYQNASGWIRIHSYFNSFGKYLYSSVYQGEGLYHPDALGIPCDVSQETLKKIDTHAISSVYSPIKELLDAQMRCKKYINGQIETLEASLHTTAYLDQAARLQDLQKLLALRKKINKYDELPTSYGNKAIEDMIEAVMQTPPIPRQAPEEPPKSIAHTPIPVQVAPSRPQDIRQAWITKTNQLLSDLKGLGDLLQPKSYHLAKEIETQLFILSWQELATPSKKTAAIHANINLALQTIPKPLDVFRRGFECDEVSVDDLALILPYVQPIDPKELFLKYFSLDNLSKLGPMLTTMQIEKCDSFYKAFTPYRDFMFYLDTLAYIQNTQILFNVCALAVREQRSALAMVLRHGLHPNQSLCQYKNMPLSVVRLASIFSMATLDILLNNGAIVDAQPRLYRFQDVIPEPVEIEVFSREQALFFRGIRSNEELWLRICKDAFILRKIFHLLHSASSDLEAAVLYNINAEVSHQLLEASSLYSTVLALACFPLHLKVGFQWLFLSASRGAVQDQGTVQTLSFKYNSQDLDLIDLMKTISLHFKKSYKSASETDKAVLWDKLTHLSQSTDPDKKVQAYFAMLMCLSQETVYDLPKSLQLLHTFNHWIDTMSTRASVQQIEDWRADLLDFVSDSPFESELTQALSHPAHEIDTQTSEQQCRP